MGNHSQRKVLGGEPHFLAGTVVLEFCINLLTSCRLLNSLGGLGGPASRSDDTDRSGHGQKVLKLPAQPLGTEEADRQTCTEKETYMEELGSELCAYSIQRSSLDHDDGFSEARQRRAVSSSWFISSV